MFAMKSCHTSSHRQATNSPICSARLRQTSLAGSPLARPPGCEFALTISNPENCPNKRATSVPASCQAIHLYSYDCSFLRSRNLTHFGQCWRINSSIASAEVVPWARFRHSSSKSPAHSIGRSMAHSLNSEADACS